MSDQLELRPAVGASSRPPDHEDATPAMPQDMDMAAFIVEKVCGGAAPYDPFARALIGQSGLTTSSAAECLYASFRGGEPTFVAASDFLLLLGPDSDRATFRRKKLFLVAGTQSSSDCVVRIIAKSVRSSEPTEAAVADAISAMTLAATFPHFALSRLSESTLAMARDAAAVQAGLSAYSLADTHAWAERIGTDVAELDD